MNSISGIGSTQGMLGMGRMGGPRGGPALTDEQKTKVQDILSNYDPNSITETTAKEIFQKFSDAGLQPGRGMKETIEAAGFDAENLRELSMPSDFEMKGGRHGGMQQHPTITDAQATTVTDILSNYNAANLSTTDVSSILSAFRDAGIAPAKGLREVIDSAGFNSDLILKIPHSSGSEGNFWASQNASQSINLSSLQSLQSILNQYDFSNISATDQTNLIQQLQTTNLFGGSINLAA